MTPGEKIQMEECKNPQTACAEKCVTPGQQSGVVLLLFKGAQAVKS